MRAKPTSAQIDLEGLVAELSHAAYAFVLRNGFEGSFVEVELGLWEALRACQGKIEDFASTSPGAGPSSGPHLRVPASQSRTR
jgi:hypothetical protein